jgi:hypothetical protein
VADDAVADDDVADDAVADDVDDDGFLDGFDGGPVENGTIFGIPDVPLDGFIGSFDVGPALLSLSLSLSVEYGGTLDAEDDGILDEYDAILDAEDAGILDEYADTIEATIPELIFFRVDDFIPLGKNLFNIRSISFAGGGINAGYVGGAGNAG